MSEEHIILRVGHKKMHFLGFEADIFALLANFSTLMNFTLGIIVTLAIVLGNPLELKSLEIEGFGKAVFKKRRTFESGEAVEIEVREYK